MTTNTSIDKAIVQTSSSDSQEEVIEKDKEKDKEDAENRHCYKIVFLGDNCVGKTSFIQKVSNKDFNHESVQCTVGLDSRCIQVDVDTGTNTKTIDVNLVDVSRILLDFSINFVTENDLLVLAYDVSEPVSFVYLESILRYVTTKRKVRRPIYLLGLKSDIKCNVISEDDINNFMLRNDIYSHYAASSTSYDNVQNVLKLMMKNYLKDIEDKVKYPEYDDRELTEDINIEEYRNNNTIFTNCCSIL